MSDPIKIEIQNLQQTFIIDGKEYVLIDKKQGENLFNKLDWYIKTLKEREQELVISKKETEELIHVVKCVLVLLGLMDQQTGTIKEAIRTGEESYMKHIMKSLKNVLVLLGKAQFSKGSEKELVEMFSFIKNVIPMIDKYAIAHKQPEKKLIEA